MLSRSRLCCNLWTKYFGILEEIPFFVEQSGLSNKAKQTLILPL